MVISKEAKKQDEKLPSSSGLKGWLLKTKTEPSYYYDLNSFFLVEPLQKKSPKMSSIKQSYLI